MSALDEWALDGLKKIISPGTIEALRGNPELDGYLDHLDAAERAWATLHGVGIVSRLEDDFAACVPALADAAVPLETWGVPLLAALAGPMAPFLSFGVSLACKVALLALEAWAAKRLANKKGP